MERAVRDAIARIDVVQNGASSSRGTGSLVTERLVLTALHVVADRSQQPAVPYPGTIRLTFPGGATEARIVNDFMDARADWVLLECLTPPPGRPLPLAELHEGDSGFVTYGFPDAQPVDGMVHSGRIENVGGEIFGVSAIQLYSDQAAAGNGEPIKGLSGAPLIVQNALAGVIRVSLMQDQRNVAGTLYACPVATILDRCGALLPLPDPCRGLPGLKTRDLPATPFRFLDRFTEKDAEIFFGRNADIRELYERLTGSDAAPIILLYGQSGVGKSSLLDAGVRPRLARTRDVRYAMRDAASTLLDTLQGLLTGEPAPGATAETLAAAWSHAEIAVGGPVVVMLDGLDDAFTHPRPDGTEVAALFAALASLAGGGVRPKGRLVLAFRKEWLPEIQQQLDARQQGYEKVFVESLRRDEIIEVVKGLTSTRRLQQRYGLEIEAGLPEMIADDLLADANSAIAPTLQILLGKMWQAAVAAKGHAPRFTSAAYQSLRREGLLLGDFLDQQLARIRAAMPELVDSGFALDVLAYHTTPLLAAQQRSHADLMACYRHRVADLMRLLALFRQTWVLVDAAGDGSGNLYATRLGHDSLAPLVRARFDASVAPGPRARRLIEGRSAASPDQKIEPLDGYDLALVQSGLMGMRALRPEEERLLAASEAKREQELRNRRRVTRIMQGAAAAVLVAVGWGVWELRQAQMWENRLVQELQQPLEALGWESERAKHPSTEAIAASVSAQYELARLTSAIRPNRAITVQYAPEGVDANKVIGLLRQLGFLVDSGPTSGPPTNQAVQIVHGADVSMLAVQQVAYTLMRAGVAVHSVGAFDDPGRYAGIIQVTAAPAGSSRLAVDDIELLASADVIDRAFRQLPQLSTVGAPLEAPARIRLVVQPFTKGLAVWIESDAGSIHVLFDDGTWREYRDSSVDSAPSTQRVGVDPREANFNPTGGFRRVWLRYELESALGLPEQKEISLPGLTGQKFSHGFMVRPVQPWHAERKSFGAAAILVVTGAETGRWQFESLPAEPNPGH